MYENLKNNNFKRVLKLRGGRGTGDRGQGTRDRGQGTGDRGQGTEYILAKISFEAIYILYSYFWQNYGRMILCWYCLVTSGIT